MRFNLNSMPSIVGFVTCRKTLNLSVKLVHGFLGENVTTIDSTIMLSTVLCDESTPIGIQMPNAKVTHLRFIQKNLEKHGDVYQGKNDSPLFKLNARLSNEKKPCVDGEYPTEIYPKN